ncbi:MAG TPA: hypothetical protein PLZ51_07090, partial [Aggregatilineales bacterium]|nr:hypothetical protein [Aggregatilineales bacterium]
MPYYPDKHHRKSIRLEQYDYRQEGAYFITICTHQYAYLFGKIQQTTMYFSDYGKIAETCWDDIP